MEIFELAIFTYRGLAKEKTFLTEMKSFSPVCSVNGGHKSLGTASFPVSVTLLTNPLELCSSAWRGCENSAFISSHELILVISLLFVLLVPAEPVCL